jgi:hypothetical protein
MASSPTIEKAIPYVLLGMTAVTGLVDAVSFLSLGRVFTANVTGNVVILAFATARVPGLSIARSLTALLSFLVGQYSADGSWPERARLTDSIGGTSIRAGGGLSLDGVVLQHRIQNRFAGEFFSPVCFDRVDGDRHGHAECRCSEARQSRISRRLS